MRAGSHDTYGNSWRIDLRFGATIVVAARHAVNGVE